MFANLGRVGARSAVDPLPSKVKRILSKFGSDAHLYTFGANGQSVQGFQHGNYFDSAGTTLASTDGSVGLVLDAAGSVGAELFVSPQTIPNNNVGQVINFGSFKTVRVTGSGIVGCNVFDKSSNTWVSLTNRHIYTDVINIYNTSGGAVTINPGDVSFKEVTGIHATQGTPGFKPTLRKGIVNLLTYSQQVMPAFGGWNGSAVGTINSSQAPDGTMSASTVTTTSDWIWKDVTGSVGTYTFAIWMRAANGTSFQTGLFLNEMSSGTKRGQTLITVTDTWTLFVVSGTTSTGAGMGRVEISNGIGGVNPPIGTQFYRAGLFAGTLTAAQILAAGGIPMTTTAPASSQAGPLHAEFLGDDYLTMGSLPITSGSDFAIVAAANCTTGTGRSVIFAQRASTSANPIALELGFLNGAPSVRVRNDAGVALTLTHGSTLVNKKCCIGARATGSTIELWVDGVMSQSATIPGTPIFTNVATIGCGSNGAGGYADYFIGSIYALLPVKGTLTDADVLTESKFAASIAGIQL